MIYEFVEEIPVRVARAALAVAEATLADYAHRFSPHRFTQPQFLACSTRQLLTKLCFVTHFREARIVPLGTYRKTT